ncbi:hypothetical protein TorRG33x02_118890, partial [Trema orientale]
DQILEVSRLQHGVTRNIFIPTETGDKHCKGWVEFSKRIESILGRNRKAGKDDFGRQQGNEGCSTGGKLYYRNSSFQWPQKQGGGRKNLKNDNSWAEKN